MAQKELAKSIEPDQSRITKLESGHPSVSLERQYKVWRKLGAAAKYFGSKFALEKSTSKISSVTEAIEKAKQSLQLKLEQFNVISQIYKDSITIQETFPSSHRTANYM